MTKVKVEGRIVAEQRESNVQWIIPSYPSRPIAKNTFLRSPQFHFLNRSWRLRFYPNGDSESGKWCAVYLVHRNVTWKEFSMTLRIELKLVLNQIEIQPPPELHTFNEDDRIYKRRKLYLTSLIWNPSDTIDIRIKCVVHEQHPQPTDHRSSFCTSLFSHDLKYLFKSEEKSDVVIKVDGLKFHAHQLILRARSSVFDKMFANDMREKNEGVIELEDCSAFIFQFFLEFLYTGELESCASYEKVRILYRMADRFSVPDLTMKCTQLLEHKMSNDRAWEVLVLANFHTSQRLEESAKRCLVHNFHKISNEQWQEFVLESEPLAAQIWEAVYLRNIS